MSFLANVEKDSCFRLEHKNIHNLKELLAEIKDMHEDLFKKHNSDFYNWIKDVINDNKLASKLKNLTLKKNYIKVLEQRIYFLEKLDSGKVSDKIVKSLNTHNKEIIFTVDKEKCILCDVCVKACTKGVIKVKSDITVDKCVLCGFCVPFCQVGALSITTDGKQENPMQKTEAIPEFKNNKIFEGTIKVNEKCVKDCEDCVSVCPTHAIKRTSKLEIDEKKCIYCGACKVACPHEAIDLKRTEILSKGGFCSDLNNAIQRFIGREYITQDHYNRTTKKVRKLLSENKFEEAEIDSEFKIIVCDTKKCTACKVCEHTCALKNEKSKNLMKSRIRVYKDVQGENLAYSCRLCTDHPCKSACPHNAISIVDNILKINDKNCVGCGQCIEVCRFGIMTMHEDKKARVCDMCRKFEYNPQCVKACPQKALSYKKIDAKDKFQAFFQDLFEKQEHPAEIIMKKLET